ncbi:Hal9p KNAG_0K00820 [Huiozyma naganishii CBS 8797]|uniref:Zn(2)-C6 fungal-type domain-containing protein n=1 Tax=Huiozyma naganishii (strain ATCC MYA-139 / BCRC 22969 / CBS 8797 / KCTC 17520 / NBRC 10181 / NCYC 3082 / Yp74L-3) TaxID=1071383 RepID=J7RRG3_HUIN7|nr:hypothetical protein KNAG_0K00820 [Kazachstania naganishii CBS 8797]CCK72448.1 hypothetical protein KNAG_0K00820 [Kazachstania naganishii CBS 8797]
MPDDVQLGDGFPHDHLYSRNNVNNGNHNSNNNFNHNTNNNTNNTNNNHPNNNIMMQNTAQVDYAAGPVQHHPHMPSGLPTQPQRNMYAGLLHEQSMMGQQQAILPTGPPPPQQMYDGIMGSPLGNFQYSSSSNGASVIPAKKRVSMACDHCRKRKIKCGPINTVENKCSHCIKYNAECTFQHRDAMQARKRNNLDPQNDDYGESAATKTPFQYEVSPNAVELEDGLQQNDPAQPKKTRQWRKKQSKKSSSKQGHESPATSQSSDQTTVLSNIGPVPGPVISKVEKLDKKVSMMIDNMARFEWLLNKLVQRTEGKREKAEVKVRSLRPVEKTYTTALLTPQKLQWIKEKLAPNASIKDFMSPINYMLTLGLKWHIIHAKKLLDFSTPAVFAGEIHIFPLPPKEQARRLLENFHATMISSATMTITLEECFYLLEKHYDDSQEQLNYPEALLLNVCLSSGALATQAMMLYETEFLRKDRYSPSKSELSTIENNTLLNAMYYYHKLSMLCSGITTIQALLLLAKYLSDKYSTELADDVLTTAIRYAVNLRLGLGNFTGNLPLKESLIRRRLWWHCYAYDNKYSMILSRPPLLSEEETDTLTDEAYLNFIRDDVLPTVQGYDPEKIENIKDVDTALAAIADYCDFITYFLSYYIYQLIKVESEVFETCFAARMTERSFDYTIEKILDIQKHLDNWKKRLHPCMKLESYKQCLCLIYTQSNEENPALSFEIACVRVLYCHFRFLYLQILLSLFTITYMTDNKHLFVNSIHDIPIIFRSFLEQYKLSCVAMLNMFMTTNYQPQRFYESRYHLFTGIFALLLHVIKYIDDERERDIPELIKLLEVSHKHMLGENEQYLMTSNVNWLTAMHLFTYLMHHIVARFNEVERRKNEYKFNPSYYKDILPKFIFRLDLEKADSYKRLVVDLQRCFHADQVFEDVTVEDIENGVDDLELPIKISDIDIFNEVNPRMLKVLYSDIPFCSSDGNPRKIQEDRSLFISDDTSYNVIYPANETNDEPTAGNSTDTRYNDEEFNSFLPFGRILFDRDYFFMDVYKTDS